jgi:hypothetical protein
MLLWVGRRMEGQSCCQTELLVFLPHNFAFGAALSLADREILQRAFESQRWIMTSKYANYFTVGRSTRIRSIALELKVLRSCASLPCLATFQAQERSVAHELTMRHKFLFFPNGI